MTLTTAWRWMMFAATLAATPAGAQDPTPGPPSVRITSAFGRFVIPFGNIGSRSGLYGDSAPGQRPVRQPDGSYAWDTFSLAFWMPDGGVVQNDASGLLNNLDATGHRKPLRPRENSRPPASPDRYVVVVGQICPTAVDAGRPSRGQGGDLVLSGYGEGAIYMYGCSGMPPTERWSRVSGPSSPEFFCGDADFCFGWIDLPAYGRKALAYLPRDAIGQTSRVAARLNELMESWRLP